MDKIEIKLTDSQIDGVCTDIQNALRNIYNNEAEKMWDNNESESETEISNDIEVYAEELTIKIKYCMKIELNGNIYDGWWAEIKTLEIEVLKVILVDIPVKLNKEDINTIENIII